MIIVIQRTLRAMVRVEGRETARTGRGLLLLAAVESGDREAEALWAAEKLAHMRIFPGEGAASRMERSVLEVGGEVMVVSQFTLAGSILKGRRPSFDGAAAPEEARPIYERLVAALRERGVTVATGVFGGMMEVELINDGPVTFILERRP